MPYPPQGAGVASFLGLLDTPAVYTGEALKSARVNEAEDAIEFGGVSPEPSVLTEEDTALFNGVAPTVWTDLQIFDAVGNKPRGLALIEFNCAVAVARLWLVRCNGELLDANKLTAHCAETNNAAPNFMRRAYVLVPCDDAGLIEWRCFSAATNVVVTLRAFIANVGWAGTFPQGLEVFSGVAPAAWTGMTLSTGKALALFRVVLNTPANNKKVVFRRYGDSDGWPATAAGGWVTGINSGVCDQNFFAYAFVPTDERGRVEWGDSGLNDWTVYLLGYITNVTMHDVLVYNAIPPDQSLGPAYFDTIDLPITKQVLAMLKNASNGGGSATWLRQTGLTAEFTYGGTQALQASGPWTGYAMQLTNEYGQLDVGVHNPAAAAPLSLQLTIP